MKSKKASVGGIIGGVITITLILLFFGGILVPHIKLWKITELGKHTGTVTAIETNGLIWKTDSVFFKTDSQSSQEDRYCILDKELKSKLEAYQESKTKVTIEYEDYLLVGYALCSDGDNGIIIGVKE